MQLLSNNQFIFNLAKNYIKGYDRYNLNLIFILEEDIGFFFQAHFYKDLFIIFTGNNTITIFEIEKRKFKRFKIKTKSRLSSGSGVWKDNFLPAETENIVLFNIHQEKIVKEFETRAKGPRFCMGILINYCISGYTGMIEVLNLQDGSIENIKCGQGEIIFNLSVDEKTDQLIVSNDLGEMEIFDFKSRSILYSLTTFKTPMGLYLYDDTICYSRSKDSKLNFYQENRSIRLPSTKNAIFGSNGDLIYLEKNDLKILKIQRPFKHLQPLKQLKSKDVFFRFDG